MKICFSSDSELHRKIFLFARITKGTDRAKRFCSYIRLSNIDPGMRILTKISNYHVKIAVGKSWQEYNSPEEITTPKALPKDA